VSVESFAGGLVDEADWDSGVDFDDPDYGYKEEDKSAIKVRREDWRGY
jgi:hypothetical protein